MTRWEVIVIGGGCNGLSAAALAARKGRRTLLVEQRPHIGGLSAAQPFGKGHAVPGLQPHPTCTTLAELSGLDLAAHGLRSNHGTAPIRVFSSERQPFVLSASAEDLAASLGSEYKAYRQYRSFCSSVAPVLRAVFGTPSHQTSLRKTVRTATGAWRSGRKALRGLARVASLSAKDFLDEFIADETLQGALAAPLLARVWAGPWSPLGALQILLFEASGRSEIVGGSPALAQALHKAAEAHDVEIRTGWRAIGIKDTVGGPTVLLETGESLQADAVIAACSPNVLFGMLLDPAQAGDWPLMRARGTCSVLALALEKKPDWGSVRHARVVPGLEDMERAFDTLKKGRIPLRQTLELRLNPDNGCVLTVFALQTPGDVRGGWNDLNRAELQDRIMNQLRAHLPELSAGIVATALWTPADLAGQFAVPGGHLRHFERDVDQLLRPPPISPMPGVFWGGGAHAESGRLCAGGVAAARAALRL